MWHCEVRDGLLVMKMSSMLFCLAGVVIICSVWVVRSMSKKRLLTMSKKRLLPAKTILSLSQRPQRN